MGNIPKCVVTNESISVVWEGKPYSVQKGSTNFLALRKAIQEKRWDDIPNYLSLAKTVKAWSNDKFEVTENTVKYNGDPLPTDLTQRILSMATNGEDPTRFFMFWEKLQQNPSFRSVQQLYPFLKHEGIPLTEDGCFLAYKAVREDYRDHHSGKFDNSPGKILEMPRNKISDDPKVACDVGFHVGALSYARNFHSSSQRLMVCKVNPRDVVSIPYDSHQEKIRVCKYEVLGHYGSQLPSTSFTEDEVDPLPPTPVPGPDDEEVDMEVEVDFDEEEPVVEPPVEEDEEEETTNPEVNPDPQVTEVKVDDSKVKEKKKASKAYSKFNAMDEAKLIIQPIEALRKYATHGLSIVGASKIPGGKIALVRRILKSR